MTEQQDLRTVGLRGVADHQTHCSIGSTNYGHGFDDCPQLRWSADGNSATCGLFRNKDGSAPRLAFGRGWYHIRCAQCRKAPIGTATEPPPEPPAMTAAAIRKQITAANRKFRALMRDRALAAKEDPGSIPDIDQQIAATTQTIARLEGCLPC